MIFYDLIRWWYGPGWLQAWRNALDWPNNVLRMFSVSILLRTLFAPWRRIITSPGSSLDSKFRASIDNFVSRIIGTIVRFFVLGSAFVVATLAFAIGLATALLWIFIPAGVLVLIAMEISG